MVEIKVGDVIKVKSIEELKEHPNWNMLTENLKHFLEETAGKTYKVRYYTGDHIGCIFCYGTEKLFFKHEINLIKKRLIKIPDKMFEI